MKRSSMTSQTTKCHCCIGSDKLLYGSLATVGLISGAYVLDQPWASKFVSLAYKDPNLNNAYDRGWDDLYFIFYWINIWSVVRIMTLRKVLFPFGVSLGTIANPQKCIRFSEEGWIGLFHLFSFIWGMYVARVENSWPDTSRFWSTYPTMYTSSLMKSYYLIETAFWTQNLVALCCEYDRRDFPFMVVHDIVTIFLLGSSYSTYFTLVGSCLCAWMDVADVFLSAAKMFKYAGYSLACDGTFVAFVFVWCYSRLYILGIFVWTSLVESMEYDIHYWDPPNGYFFSYNAKVCFFSLLLLLCAIILYWTWLIARVLMKVVKGGPADDADRSDDEGNMSKKESKKKNK